MASVICTSSVASRSSPLRLKTSWCLHLDLEVEVAVRAAGRADLALAGQLQAHAGVDAGGDVDGDRCAWRARGPGPAQVGHGFGMTVP